MFVEEPIIVSVPPNIVANDNGISKAPGVTPTEPAHSLRIGIIIAQTGVLFINADMQQTAIVMRRTAASYPCGEPSKYLAMSWRPPVTWTVFATAHMTPTVTTPSAAKPLSASFVESTPVATSATTASRRTKSGGRSKAICTRATTRTAAVMAADLDRPLIAG